MAKTRGRESAGDMVRSLSLVLAVVAVAFFFANPRVGDRDEVRVVDPSGDVRAFSAEQPTVPVPRTPPGWRPTVSDFDRETSTLRVGWVTPKGEYAEYASTAAATPSFVRDFTGAKEQDGTVDIDGVTWTRYRHDEAISLVRAINDATVVLGTRRESASLDELRVLAAALSG